VLRSDDCDDDEPLLGARADDMDCDGLPDDADNCPEEANPDQVDSDVDGRGDACEDCFGPDGDGDFVPDMCDVCPDIADDQTDSVGDGVGDACRDTDSDGVRDAADNCPADANADQVDADRDGKGDACDDDPPVIVEDSSGGCATGSAWTGLAWLALLMVVLMHWRRRRIG
jgi:MYXO-CTERM domain-containing protein